MGTEELLCPSVWPSMPGAKVFGVVDRSDEQPKLVSLQRPVPVTPELLELAAPADPTHVFRFSGKCAGGECQHFDGSDCTLANRIVQLVLPERDDLPACAIRPSCRWWAQEGKDACVRCNAIISNYYGSSLEVRQAAQPPAL